MKILNLYIENIKRVKAVEVTPEGNAVIISGKNGNGKSSTIDSIAMALGGAKLIPEKPVRVGEDHALIQVDLGEYKVTRVWKEDGSSSLKIENKDGAKITNAQTFLDKIVGNLAFDPQEFTVIEPKKRIEILKSITGLDFTDLDKRHKALYEERASINKEGQLLKARIETEFAGVEDVEVVPVDEIKKQKAEAVAYNQNIKTIKNKALEHEQGIKKIEQEIQNAKQSILEFEKFIKDAESKLEGFRGELQLLSSENLEPKDLEQFDSYLEAHFKAQAAKEKYQNKQKVEAQIKETREKWENKNTLMKEIEQAKQDMVSKAKMPIKGIAFGDGEVTFDGIPFGQLSSAQQIKISFAIAIALNPKLKIAIIKNGSLLDSDAMKEITKIAQESDYQVWIEKVSDKPEAGAVYIEDGEVVKK